jgi:CRP/FNR family cyclic AMP-dependent transcriptional regulator
MTSVQGKYPHNALLSTALTKILCGDLCNILMANRAPVTFEKNGILYDAEDGNLTVFFLRSGVVKVGTITEAGREIIYDLRKAGDVVGELCISANSRPNDRAVALERTEAVPVPYEEILDVVQRDRDLLRTLLELMGEMLNDAYDRVDSLAVDHTDRMVIKILLRLAARHGRPVGKTIELSTYVTQEEISQMVGRRRERVSTFLHSLRVQEIIQYSEHGHLRLDIIKLEKMLPIAA